MLLEALNRLPLHGVIYLPNYFEPQNLISEFPKFLPKAKEVYGSVKQDFYYQYYALDQLSEFPATASLVKSYLQTYHQIANYQIAEPVIAFNHYLPGGIIDPHRDESRYRNLIAIFTLSGEAPFAIYKEDRKTKIQEYLVTSNSLLLLTAPKNDAEKDVRPIHSVGPTKVERKAIIIRHQKAKEPR